MPIRQDTLILRWLAANNYAASTEQTYTETLRAFQRRYPQHAERVTSEMLVDFLTTEPDGSKATRAPSTLDRQRTTLRVFWKWCKREGFVKANPAEGLEDIHLGTGRPGPAGGSPARRRAACSTPALPTTRACATGRS